MSQHRELNNSVQDETSIMNFLIPIFSQRLNFIKVLPKTQTGQKSIVSCQSRQPKSQHKISKAPCAPS